MGDGGRRILIGMKEIGDYMGGKSDDFILELIRSHGFPAKQTRQGGAWISNKGAIDEWSYFFSRRVMQK